MAMRSFDHSDIAARVRALSADQRLDVGGLLVDVAAADGQINAEEVQTLMTLFASLGLDQAKLFELLQEKAAVHGDSPPAVAVDSDPGRVRVQAPPETAAVDAPPDRSDHGAARFSSLIQSAETPVSESALENRPAAVPLDEEAIDRKLADDALTTALLSDIFADEGDFDEDFATALDEDLGVEFDEDSDVEVDVRDTDSGADSAESGEVPGLAEQPTRRGQREPEAFHAEGPMAASYEGRDLEGPGLAWSVSPARAAGVFVWGLDVEHARLAVALTRESRWSRSDVEGLAGPLGLGMLNGAIDVINEAAFENCDELLLDGEDPLELNDYAAERLIEAAVVDSDVSARALEDDWRMAASLVMGVEPGDPTL